MLANDLTLLVILSASSIATFKLCNEILWYKAQHVFDLGGSTSKNEIMDLNVFKEHEFGFLVKFCSQFSLSSQRVTRFFRILFASTFSLCLVAVELTLWQIVTAGNNSQEEPGFVAMAWLVVSVTLALNLILVQPFLILLSILNKFYGDKLGIEYLTMISSALILAWILALSTLNWGPFHYSSSLLTKLSMIGVSIMAILSGIASMSTPYYVFQFLWHKHDKESVQYISSSIPVLLLDEVVLLEKKHECEMKIQESLVILRKLDQQPGGSDSILRQQLIDQISKYQLELAKLEPVTRDPKNIRLLKRGFQLVFLIYCMYKLIVTFVSRIPAIINHSIKYPADYTYQFFEASNGSGSASGDPLAVTLSKVTNFLFFRFQDQLEKDSLTKQVSLLLSLSLFGCSVSTVITTVSFLTTLLPLRLQILALKTIQENTSSDILPTSNKQKYRNHKNPSVIKNLLISELTGVYVTATILMVRSNLPTGVAQQLNEMLGEKFGVSDITLQVWFDKVFAVSALLSLIGIKVAERTAAP
ncbi:LANO_0B05688g1_1 [Lachancea nothofagi CBS 11611]|uniref:LANO_0B05688g1_1 n=1 Tax=Lachancea nothofagi CBS 11611 TaxID=1266666 RepID=A0A1G4IYI9_9SACH|nr:LANO_0B05688g1_1 [Lachancea nothofagi CBS 11611]